MTQRNVEIVIGRLLTDEEFRLAFLADAERALRELVDRGTHLNQSEMAALLSIDVKLWRRGANQIDPRLQKAQLKSLAAGNGSADPADDQYHERAMTRSRQSVRVSSCVHRRRTTNDETTTKESRTTNDSEVES